jgi:phospholipid/cholesterol/gamma-HCH transport system ATP-binding protein
MSCEGENMVIAAADIPKFATRDLGFHGNDHGNDIVIRVKGLVTRFGAQTVHDGADLEVRRGEVLGVVGGSGSGKSVLLRAIIGLKRPDAGSIEVLGSDVLRLGEAEARALEQRWGVLFQGGALFSSLTVAENIEVPLREHCRMPAPLMDEIAGCKIALVGLPDGTGDKFPAQLSGGMTKRAGLARALALDPEILFLDEPTAGLDPIAASEFDRLIGDLKAALGLTVFLVTHDLDTLYAICDRVAVLVDKKVRIGTLAQHLQDNDPWFRAYFHGPRGRAAAAAALPHASSGG